MKNTLKIGRDLSVDISEKELAEISPDYSKWRRRLLVVNFIMALSVVCLEIGVNIILIVQNQFEGTLADQVIFFFLIPSVLNLAAVFTDLILVKKFPKKTSMLNYVLVLTVTFMSTVVAFTHYVFSITLTVFTIPVLISIIFVNRRLTNTTAICSCVGLLMAVLWRYIDGDDSAKHFVIPETVIALGIILMSLIVARLIISMMEQQNTRLINAVIKEKRSQEEALSANKAKSTFLANMSHEIRTPINAVLGMNEMILREEKDPTIRSYSETIRTAGNSLLAIINDVLDISKIESGRMEILKTEYELSSLVSDCCSMIAIRAQDKGLQLNVGCKGTVPLKLVGDEPHIRQVVMNLLTNAVKYTDEGSVTLTVSGECSENICRLRFSVRDTGIGISEEDRKNLFDQFQRLDMKRNRNVEGTGLGLAIVRKLCELMDGSIEVNSEPGKGSEFIFELPQDIAGNSAFGEINVNYSAVDALGYSHSFEAPDAHILIVDDLPVNQMVIVNLLKDTRIKTATAGSGRECLELAAKQHFDLILMDHMMPEMDGVETYRKLRADKDSPNCGTPVIMLTANALSGMREEYIGEGFADYISKPVRGAKLEEVISRNLPQELVLPPTDKEEQSAAPDSGEFAALVEALPQLNLVMAMQYCCGSPELYRDVLSDYCESGRYDEMNAAFAGKRWEDYRRCAHSLKSTSKTIGLDGLSERARASELALKNGMTDFAVLDHEELMGEYAEALSAIRGFLKNDKRE